MRTVSIRKLRNPLLPFLWEVSRWWVPMGVYSLIVKLAVSCDKRWSTQFILSNIRGNCTCFYNYWATCWAGMRFYGLFFHAVCGSCCNSVLLLYRRKSRSISPLRRKSRSPTPRRRRSRSATPRRYKRQRSTSASLSPIKRSPSNGSLELKNVTEKSKKDEEEKKRYTPHSHCHTLLLSFHSWYSLINIVLRIHNFIVVFFLVCVRALVP